MIKDKSMFENIYRDNVERVYRYLYYRLRDREKSEDAMQDVFLRALESDNLIDKTDLNVWILGIARNVVRENYRHNIKEDNYSLDETFDVPDDIDENIEKVVLDDEMGRMIREELEQLDDLTKEIIILKLWEELKFDQIARIINSDIGSTKMRYYRGMKKIEENLKKKREKKMFVFGMPAIAFGIREIANNFEFKADPKFMSILWERLETKLNLNINNKNMDNNISTEVVKKGRFATTREKVIVGAIVTFVITSILALIIGAVVINNMRARDAVFLSPSITPTVTDTPGEGTDLPATVTPSTAPAVVDQSTKFTLKSENTTLEFTTVLPEGAIIADKKSIEGWPVKTVTVDGRMLMQFTLPYESAPSSIGATGVVVQNSQFPNTYRLAIPSNVHILYTYSNTFALSTSDKAYNEQCLVRSLEVPCGMLILRPSNSQIDFRLDCNAFAPGETYSSQVDERLKICDNIFKSLTVKVL